MNTKILLHRVRELLAKKYAVNVVKLDEFNKVTTPSHFYIVMTKLFCKRRESLFVLRSRPLEKDIIKPNLPLGILMCVVKKQI